MQKLFFALKSKEVNSMEYYVKCNISPSENKVSEHKQQAIDYAHHVNTLDFCINRVNSFVEVFRNQIKKEKHDFSFLQFLRKRYQLINLKDDPYLSNDVLNISDARLRKMHASTEVEVGPFVIALNHKCAVRPNFQEVKDLRNHPLSQQFEIMRRVVVEVAKGDDTNA